MEKLCPWIPHQAVGFVGLDGDGPHRCALLAPLMPSRSHRTGEQKARSTEVESGNLVTAGIHGDQYGSTMMAVALSLASA